ncbi:MAG: hypothetical protein Q4B86_04680 [Eubacteriales bacterium]|nr:hypothetical protein [Eubacteriales bacterium]
MNKREFLSHLKERLSYDLPMQLVRSNVDFYSDYIDAELKKGRDIKDILDELGDPNLIAGSIIDAVKSGADGIPYTDDDNDFSSQIYGGKKSEGDYRENSWSSYDDNSQTETFDESGNSAGTENNYSGRADNSNGWKNINISSRGIGIGGCILSILVSMVVFSVVSAIIGLLSPFIAPILIIILLFWLLNGRRRY